MVKGPCPKWFRWPYFWMLCHLTARLDHGRSGRGFLRKVFLICRGEILSVRTQISTKAPFCGGDFSLWVCRQSIHTTNESICLRCKCKITNITQIIDGVTVFLRGNLNREKSRGGGKFTISHLLTGITSIYWFFFESEFGRKAPKKFPSRWRRSICTELFRLRRMERWRDICNCTIFMCGFVVTTAIAGVMVEITYRKFRHYP